MKEGNIVVFANSDITLDVVDYNVFLEGVEKYPSFIGTGQYLRQEGVFVYTPKDSDSFISMACKQSCIRLKLSDVLGYDWVYKVTKRDVMRDKFSYFLYSINCEFCLISCIFFIIGLYLFRTSEYSVLGEYIIHINFLFVIVYNYLRVKFYY